MSSEFSHGVLNPLWLRNHTWVCVHLHAQAHTVRLAPLQVEAAVVCWWGRSQWQECQTSWRTKVIASLESGIFVFKMYCCFKNQLKNAVLPCYFSLHLWAPTCEPAWSCSKEAPTVPASLSSSTPAWGAEQGEPVNSLLCWKVMTCLWFRKINSQSLLLRRHSSSQLHRQMQGWTFGIQVWKSQPERFFGCSGAMWGLKVEGQDETSCLKVSLCLIP